MIPPSTRFDSWVRKHRGADVIQRAFVASGGTPSTSRACQARHARTYSACVSSKSSSRRDERVLTGLHRGGTEPERHHERSVARHEIDFAGDRDVSVLGARVGAVEPFVGVQLLPSVGDADESDGSGEPRRRGRQRQGVVLALGEQHRRALVVADPRGVAGARVREMRREQHVQMEIRERALERARSARAAARRRATDRSGSPSRSDSGRQRRCCESDTPECRAPPVTSRSGCRAFPPRSTIRPSVTMKPRSRVHA